MNKQISWTEESALKNKDVLERHTGLLHEVIRVGYPRGTTRKYFNGGTYVSKGWYSYIVKPIDMPLDDCFDPHFPDDWKELTTKIS